MSRARGEAFENLKLDAAFFQRVLRKDAIGAEDEAAPDYDIYLMEKGMMPLLVQGLDALSREVEKVSAGTSLSGGGRAPFNPLTWLAQYLLRNHPGKVKDHRTAIYQRLGQMASIEKGRRCVLRRRGEMVEEWQRMEKSKGKGGALLLEDLPAYMKSLDDKWHLQGAFARKFPENYKGVVDLPDGGNEVQFFDFWEWFEVFVSANDVLRATEFEDAERRQVETERQANEATEERKRREKAMLDVLENRRNLEEQFASLSADLYTNEYVTLILNKGAVIEGFDEQEGGVPLKGVHIELIVAMLSLWGFQCQPTPEDAWDVAALASWGAWLAEYGPERAEPRVDSVNMKWLMDRDVFEAFMKKKYPAPDADGDVEMRQTMAVRTLVESDDIDVFIEAIDEETGEIRQLFLPENQVEEVRRRLADGDEPVLARVDLVSQRVLSLQEPGQASPSIF